MTHDPLCPHDKGAYHELGENSCVCDLLAKADARATARTLDKARDAITRDVRELMRLIVREFPRFNGRDGAQEALNHAIEAIDALRGES